jgi:hypothetical protein
MVYLMEKEMEVKKRDNKTLHMERLIKLFFRGVIPIFLLVSGVVVLALKISGWSLLLGAPMVVFGCVFLIYTYDEVVAGRVADLPDNPGITKCSLCGAETPKVVGISSEDAICPSCREGIMKSIRNKSRQPKS